MTLILIPRYTIEVLVAAAPAVTKGSYDFHSLRTVLGLRKSVSSDDHSDKTKNRGAWHIEMQGFSFFCLDPILSVLPILQL